MADLEKLINRVARHLAGRPVTIRWRWPAAEHAMGQCYRTAEGQIVIDIAPVAGLEAKWNILLHELAHARLGHAISTGVELKAPGSVSRDVNQRAAWRTDPRELAANELAGRWDSYAEKNAWKQSCFLANTLAARLRALLFWRDENDESIS